MTMQTVDAVFDHGMFRLVQPLAAPLEDGQRVRLVIETEEPPDAILAIAAGVYDGLSPQDVHEIEQIAFRQNDFFGEQS